MRKEKSTKYAFNYFVTPFGRKIGFFAAGATTIGLFFGNYMPNTFFLDKYREFMQCYREGIERPVPDVVKARLEKAMDILDVSWYERKVLKPFVVYGFDLFLAGSTKSKFGGLIGIPNNYSFQSVDDIDRSEIKFRMQSIKWRSEAGELLEESLVLTEDEQIFGFCKTILELQTHRVLLNSVFPSLSFLSMYTVGNYLNQRLNLYAKPLPLRLCMYTILGLFGLGSWSFLTDYNQVMYETTIDKKLCELGPEFVDAGRRFYDKLLKRNIALRSLLGDDTYTAKGNENFLFRQKTLPLTLHKQFFEEKLNSFTEQPEKAAI